MRIGLPKEVKQREFRVGLTPAGVQTLVHAGNTVVVEHNSGLESGFNDIDYEAAGAQLGDAADAWAADIVVKVKEPLAEEYQYFREGQIIFTYLHLAANRPLTEALISSGVTAVAYETIQLDNGSLPLLAPMSEVAGRMSVQVGSRFLEKTGGGHGVLLGGVPGVLPARVVVVGGGIVGSQAMRVAVGMGADVTVLDVNGARLREIDDQYQGRVKTLMSNSYNLQEAVRTADLVVGAVLIPGARAPKLVTRGMISEMRSGSVVVDVAVDQGGCIETANRVTTHDEPTYVVDGVVHYAVANMPGAVPRTSTFALTNATLPYVAGLAKGGIHALADDHVFLKGLNVGHGKVTCKGVAEAFNMDYADPLSVLSDVVAAV
ncbi:alanine dehydrogenase [Alicyclobacillus mengziensis]|uniref:Alanine dehydrogenase n=1 Tax=Alicyclobacillus mengziensis TaxID=2931921 RepID=A0A9X7W310_9BACL|nr:alanine dehydrogenase [Alicyclobacillus mengziensis]QSO49257.1 alanine dehydrogenase [Alicyclobacillus mengziensis]